MTSEIKDALRSVNPPKYVEQQYKRLINFYVKFFFPLLLINTIYHLLAHTLFTTKSAQSYLINSFSGSSLFKKLFGSFLFLIYHLTISKFYLTIVFLFVWSFNVLVFVQNPYFPLAYFFKLTLAPTLVSYILIVIFYFSKNSISAQNLLSLNLVFASKSFMVAYSLYSLSNYLFAIYKKRTSMSSTDSPLQKVSANQKTERFDNYHSLEQNKVLVFRLGQSEPVGVIENHRAIRSNIRGCFAYLKEKAFQGLFYTLGERSDEENYFKVFLEESLSNSMVWANEEEGELRENRFFDEGSVYGGLFNSAIYKQLTAIYFFNMVSLFFFVLLFSSIAYRSTFIEFLCFLFIYFANVISRSWRYRKESFLCGENKLISVFTILIVFFGAGLNFLGRLNK